ncbi:hypothetical protein [Bacillus cereus group sp. TH152-1LC]|uniref:hypothetical protein n=1 Tax=Bacillus cereus group sp. TH152-1LC TaxID=3018060 RepID=UPI0022DF7540|nr:hypothetical protein [Bacillus cereus group sp. TH152-1LC]MDA1674681.1 hypothetical protein [Bacillus cereus group sp. TH152-1LC]
MSKKLLSALTCGAIVLGLAACGSEEKTTTNSSPKTEEPTKQKENNSSTKTVIEDSKNAVGLTPEQYLKNYNKIKDRFAKEKVKLLPFEDVKTEYGPVLYITTGIEEKQPGYTRVTYHINKDGKTISNIQYVGPMDEMSTIQAMVEATGMPWDAEVSQLVESKGKSAHEVRKNGWIITVDKSVVGVRVHLISLFEPKKSK